ncbi:response regulator [Azohydromonas lata]|uniref:response regulator n=1 Tax=Azohydromonas lata TaxID=45677 RepID=UPI0008366683|nr:response regulator [Azohydromonas lata]
MTRGVRTCAAARLLRWLWLLGALLACGVAGAAPSPLVRLKVELLALDASVREVDAARQAPALSADAVQLTLPFRDHGSWLRITPSMLPVRSVLIVEGNVSGPLTLVLPYGARETRTKLRPAPDMPVAAYAQVFELPDVLVRGTPLLLHVSHQHRAIVRVKLMDAEAWRAEERLRLVSNAVFYTAVLTFAVIAACYWAVLRERMLGHYTLYQLTLLLFTACNAGYVYAWPGGALWARLGMHGQWLLATLAMVFSLGFTRGFLSLPQQAPRLSRLYARLRAAALAGAALLLLSPVHLDYAGVVLSVAILVNYLLLLGTGVCMTLRGNRYAVYYIVSWAPLTVSVALRALQGMGVRLPFEGEFLYALSLVWQALVLTIGMADQVLAARRERDVARQAAAQAAQLELQNTYLKENMRLREEVERMSRHDLKTPLASIVALPRLVREAGALNADQAELLALVERAGYRVLTMVNLSLDLLKMEQGSYRFEPAAVDLELLLHKVVADLGALTAARRVSVCVRQRSGPEAAPMLALAEETLCYSILANLLKNAIEAAPQDSVVTIRLVPGDPLWVHIHNLGAVPAAVRGRFFEKYATAGKSDGSGFGTYSARLMARIQEGELVMRTDEAEGTTLSLRLRSAAGHGAAPARPADAPPQDTDRPDEAELPRLNVLIVDDDEHNLLVMRRSLPSPPLTLRTAATGCAALQAHEAQPADVIFMDLEMPLMSGVEAVQALRAREKETRCRPTLVVALTSHEDEATRSRCLQAGFDLYLSKPVGRQELHRALRGAGGVPGGQTAVSPVPPQPLPDPQAALELDPDLRDTLPSFLHSRRQALDEMAQALREGDGASLRSIAHRLAGSFALHGFRWAAHCCQQIEHADADAPVLQAQLEALRRHLETVRITFGEMQA